MLKLTSKYNKKTDVCSVKTDCKNTNTYEHLYAINQLIQNIIANDEMTSYLDIRNILDSHFMPKKEEKKNGKRNSKPKTEV